MTKVVAKLAEIRDYAGERVTAGLSDDVLQRFEVLDPLLERAVDEALAMHRELRADFGEYLSGSEKALAEVTQASIVNFYPATNVNPYVSLAAAGPWVITTHGAVVHDSGGYGMLGHGHGPQQVIEAMSRPWVMANVMTPSLSHKRFTDRLRAEVGHSREGGCPFEGFVCLNSGSESVTLAARVSDIHAKPLTEPGGRHHGKTVKFLGLEGGFHGRTDKPAQVSDSCLASYKKHLRSFSIRDNLVTVRPNDLEHLRQAFAAAEAEDVYFEMLFMEPVMGEGDPGKAITREFYDLARQLTREHGALLLMDSIQAGFRGQGVLSIVDYPGFQDADPPDMETYSKALNGGQYPLSVLALRKQQMYVRGVYGNTMTTNPRALEVAVAVLDSVDDALRAHIREAGALMVELFKGLMAEVPDKIVKVQGTGLLVSVELAEGLEVLGWDGIEARCRHAGIGVIHGGANSLRYTPHFRVTRPELELIVDNLRLVLATL